MPLKRFLTASLMIASLGVGAASCAKTAGAFPPATDLIVQPKPVPPDEVLTSRIAGEQYDNAVEAYGEAGWSQVARLCRFFERQGMPGLDCPGADEPLP